jgi:hypothetical protein
MVAGVLWSCSTIMAKNSGYLYNIGNQIFVHAWSSEMIQTERYQQPEQKMPKQKIQIYRTTKYKGILKINKHNYLSVYNIR